MSTSAVTRPDTAYLRPGDVAAALRARAEHPDWLVLAGGTDVMVDTRLRDATAGVLDVFGLAGLRGIGRNGNGIRIGAATTYSDLLADPLVRDLLPALHAAAVDVGSLQIRERGTVGGNVTTSSPVGDLLPPLLALDAAVLLGSVRGERLVPYAGFCTGYRTTVLEPDELVLAVVLPVPAPGTVQHWRKVGTRAAQAISKVAFAGAARLEAGRAVGVRLAFGGVADRPVRLTDVEALVEGVRPTAAVAAEVRRAAAAAVRPLDDLRSTAEYRTHVTGALAARFVLDVVSR